MSNDKKYKINSFGGYVADSFGLHYFRGFTFLYISCRRSQPQLRESHFSGWHCGVKSASFGLEYGILDEFNEMTISNSSIQEWSMTIILQYKNGVP
jgi:hypothetical protein